jgi:hypothetical protein
MIPQKLIKPPKYIASTYEHDVMIVKVFQQSQYPTFTSILMASKEGKK